MPGACTSPPTCRRQAGGMPGNGMNGGTASNGLPTFPMGLPHSAGSGKQRCLASGDLGVAVALQRTGLVMGAGPRLPGPKSARSRWGAGTTGAAACLLHVFVTHFRRDFAPGATRRGRTSEKPTPWMMSDAPGWGDDRKRITPRRQLDTHPAWACELGLAGFRRCRRRRASVLRSKLCC